MSETPTIWNGLYYNYLKNIYILIIYVCIYTLTSLYCKYLKKIET